MTILKFPLNPDQFTFFKEITEEGYHIFSLKNAKKQNFYPNSFPDYPGVSSNDLRVGDRITVRVFFRL